MNRPTSPMVPIQLDKQRHILFDLNALIAFEEVTGRSVMTKGSMENLTLRDIRALLWVGLRHEDADLTIEQVGAMIHTGNMTQLTTVLLKAQELQFPAGDGGDPPTRSTG